jgi:hypothetical protein
MRPVSRTKALWPAIVALAATIAWSSAGAGAPCAAAAPGGYPTFCAIPATPTDVRGADAFKAAVVETRLEGRRVARASGPDTFNRPDTGADAFAASARAASTFTPAAGAPAAAESEAFAASLRDRATPPKRHRR